WSQLMKYFQKVTARPGRGVQDRAPARPARSAPLSDLGLQEGLEQALALANRSPADGVQIGPIDQSAIQEATARPVLVDVVKRRPRIEAPAVAKRDAVAGPSQRAQQQGERPPPERSPGRRMLAPGVCSCFDALQRCHEA